MSHQHGTVAAPPGRFPLSLQQEFLRLIDSGEDSGPFGPWYTIVGGWRLTGPLDLPALQGALDDLVVRHESLRTALVREEDGAHQEVGRPSSPDLAVHDLGAREGSRDLQAEELVNEVEATPFGMDRTPLLGGVLGRFDERDAVLALAAHHTAVDGWSMQLVVRDLAELYAARRQGRPAVLPPPGQYREFVAWQREYERGPAAQKARDHWRDTLRGARVTPIPTDLSRADGHPATTAWQRFMLPESFRTATLRAARTTRATPFMVLLAAYVLMLRDLTGRDDIVAPTFTPGRMQSRMLDTVGSFYNFIPLRVDLSGCRAFRDVVDAVRRTCLDAYAHELPFNDILAEAPDLMADASEDRAADLAFQVVQSPLIMADQAVGDLRWTAMRRRLLPQPVGSALPDGALWNLELNAPGIVGSAGFLTSLFSDQTMTGLVIGFQRVLSRVLADPDVRLDQI
ncbi:condensation domain-containing protein [Actinomadura harenae]|uniref:Condensation protein n=1 Tax=Actinomadura harenae TaxID=2483351 RepID=A0A3M2LV02_9ACTN|nr:condensation domain-containing protein [Actinomadura harenae]RMI40740.1 condensation protein [Actinomadura harenae]